MNRSARTIQITTRLAALSDPVRLRLMRLLEREELSVGEIARVLQLPQSTVSRHLKVLADTSSGDGSWLVKRADGTAGLYRLVLDDLPVGHRALWLTVRDQLEETADLAEDARRLQAILDERRTDTKAFFGRVAGEWDSVRNDLFGDRATLQALLPLLPHHWTVADVGCGTGNAAEVLAPCVSKVLCVDQSQPMLDAARKRLSAFRNVEFLRGELEALPIQPGTVDAAVCVLVMHHIPDPAKATREMARILRPGGTALIVDMVEHDRAAYRHTMGHRWLGFGVPQIIRWLSDAGLRQPRFQALPPASEAKGPGLFACTAHKPPEPS
jgi:ArsR family transcriptional regulator